MSKLSVALLKASALIQRLDDQGLLDERAWAISGDGGESWVRVEAFARHPVCVRRHRFAIWRETADIYVVDECGAVGDDPIDLGDVGRSQ